MRAERAAASAEDDWPNDADALRDPLRPRSERTHLQGFIDELGRGGGIGQNRRLHRDDHLCRRKQGIGLQIREKRRQLGRPPVDLHFTARLARQRLTDTNCRRLCQHPVADHEIEGPNSTRGDLGRDLVDRC